MSVLRMRVLLGVLALVAASAASGSTLRPSTGHIVFASNRGENVYHPDLVAVAVGRYERRNLSRTPFDNEWHPVPSPDGSRLVFERGFQDHGELYVAKADGTEPRPIGPGADAAWSPDGARIAYTYTPVGLPPMITVVRADGSGQTKITQGRAPSWSPDGTRIAFGDTQAFFVVNADGGGRTRLGGTVPSDGFLTPPQWSSDGRRLALQTGGLGNVSITVVTTDGSAAATVATGDHPRWSADGQELAFRSSLQGEGIPGIGVIRPDGSDFHWLVAPDRGVWVDYPTWSPDGTRLAFFRRTVQVGRQLWVINRDGSGRRQVSRESRVARLLEAERPAWIDNDTVVYVSQDNSDEFDLYTIRPNGTGLRRLTNNDVDEHDPVWSPDGRRIAFTRDVATFTPPSGVRPAIYVMRADGGGVKRLTRTSDGWSPAWSPDGRRIAFVGIWQHAAALFVMNADGSGVHRVPNTALGGTEFTAVDWSRDGTRLVYTAHAGTGETQLFSIPVRGGAPRQLTDNNSYYVTGPRWAPDGRAIAFIKHTYCGHQCEVASLVKRTRSGVHHGLVKRATGAGWSPDGRELAFSDNRLGIVSADGTSRRYLTSPSPNVDMSPNWTSH